MITTPTEYAPRTRAGLLISCAGYAFLAASAVVPALASALGPVTGVGYVLAVLVVAYVPRLIRPGSTWLRVSLPRGLATAVSIGAAVVALAAVTARTSGAAPAWSSGATALIVAVMVLVALAAPERPRRQQP